METPVQTNLRDAVHKKESNTTKKKDVEYTFLRDPNNNNEFTIKYKNQPFPEKHISKEK